MIQENLTDLFAFMTVAREGNYTKAAAQLRVSQSGLSRTIKALEERMGFALLIRTTRSMRVTDAGQKVLDAIVPRFAELEQDLEALSMLSTKPSGKVRITTIDYAADTYIWPRLVPLLKNYPDIQIELINDYGLANIVRDRYDIGIRLGDQIENDMVASRIGPDMTMVIVGSPDYLKINSAPQTPQELLKHNCINLRLPTLDALMPWELRKGSKEVMIQVDGQLVFNTSYQMLNAALAGFGLAYLPKEMVEEYIMNEKLVGVLNEWSPTYVGFHLYYRSRRQKSLATSLVIDALKLNPKLPL